MERRPEPPSRPLPPVGSIRELRLAARASQALFAERLGVTLVTYRAWDSGRRQAPLAVLEAARALAAVGADDRPLALHTLATLLHVSVFRLREAARDGRLVVTYERRVVFGHLIPRATRAAGEAYKRQFYNKRAKWVARPAVPAFGAPPSDYDRRLIQLRNQLRVSQAQLARRIGAAGKAVVYQWEARKRAPSPLLWQKLVELGVMAREGRD